jgi:hypothetical protein
MILRQVRPLPRVRRTNSAPLREGKAPTFASSVNRPPRHRVLLAQLYLEAIDFRQHRRATGLRQYSPKGKNAEQTSRLAKLVGLGKR